MAARPSKRASPRDAGRIAWSPWMIVALGGILRGLLALRMAEPPELWRGDARTYLEILQGLLQGRLVSDAWIWPPGYPLLALPLYPVLRGNALPVVSWLTGLAVVALLVAVARKTTVPRAFLVAATIVAFHPEAALASARPLPAAPALLFSLIAAVGLETASRTRRAGWGAAAGVAAGLAVLIRPETAVSVALYAVIVVIRRARAVREAAAFAICAGLCVLPYVIALHEASGVWSFSLKPHLNQLKLGVYREGTDFAERRMLWDDYLAGFEDERGEPDYRRLAAESDLRGYLLGRDTFRTIADNAAYALRRESPFVGIFWLLGAAGLVAPGRRWGRERLLDAESAAPLVGVSAFFPAVERYAVVGVPAFAWGIGIGLHCVLERARGTRPWPRSVPIAVVTVAALAGSWIAVRESASYHWTGRYGELLVETRRGNLEEARTLLEEALRLDPRNPQVLEASGKLHERRGNLDAALRAYRRAMEHGGSPVPLAALLLRTGRGDDAERLIAPLRAKPPETAEYWSLVGHVALRRSDWSGAAAAFQRSEGLGAPPDVSALNRGMALLRAGRKAEARAELSRALASDHPGVREAARAELDSLAVTAP